MTRDEALRLAHAYADGELDAVRCAELEALMAADPAVRAAVERVRELSSAIRGQAEYHAVPASLAARWRSAPPEAAPSRRRFRLVQAALLAGVAFFTWAATFSYFHRADGEPIVRDVLASHVRATLGERLIDVASSDQHTVKPWLSARLPFSPPVVDLSAQGFGLRGGRVDQVGGEPVAVLVYARRRHMIDVFVWPARDPGAGGESTHDGFNLRCFELGGMAACAISDLNRNELGDFARALQHGAS